MKITTLNNSEIVIQANVKKGGDWDKVKDIALKMVADAHVDLEIASSCEFEQWIHLTAVSANYQASEIKDSYAIAKSEV